MAWTCRGLSALKRSWHCLHSSLYRSSLIAATLTPSFELTFFWTNLPANHPSKNHKSQPAPKPSPTPHPTTSSAPISSPSPISCLGPAINKHSQESWHCLRSSLSPFTDRPHPLAHLHLHLSRKPFRPNFLLFAHPKISNSITITFTMPSPAASHHA